MLMDEVGNDRKHPGDSCKLFGKRARGRAQDPPTGWKGGERP